MLVDEVQQDGGIDQDEGELLKNAIELFRAARRRTSSSTGWTWRRCPVTATKEEVAALFTETKYSRLLIYRGLHRPHPGHRPPEGLLCRLRRDG